MKQRSRGRNNNGGGKKHMPPRNQTFDSNGPDIRIRGNAHQVLEKYLTLARDATAQGDRIAAENYYQHAEHYFRVINSQNQASGRPNDRPLPTPADDQLAMAGDMDGEDGEGHEEEAAEEGAAHDHAEGDGHEPEAEAEPRRGRGGQSAQDAAEGEAEPRRARGEQSDEERAPRPPRRRREPREPREERAGSSPAEQSEPAEA